MGFPEDTNASYPPLKIFMLHSAIPAHLFFGHLHDGERPHGSPLTAENSRSVSASACYEPGLGRFLGHLGRFDLAFHPVERFVDLPQLRLKLGCTLRL